MNNKIEFTELKFFTDGLKTNRVKFPANLLRLQMANFIGNIGKINSKGGTNTGHNATNITSCKLFLGLDMSIVLDDELQSQILDISKNTITLTDNDVNSLYKLLLKIIIFLKDNDVFCVDIIDINTVQVNKTVLF